MTITQETANLVETLAHAASQIGSTAASAKINQLIVDLLPGTNESAESIAEALRQDNIALKAELDSTQKSALIMAENLEMLRGRMANITQIATDSVGESASTVSEELVNVLADSFREIIILAEPIADAVPA